MDNLKKYRTIFAEAFLLTEEEMDRNPDMKQVDLWDSVGHINLIVAIEEAFQIEMSIEEMGSLTSYEAGRAVLRNYGVDI